MEVVTFTGIKRRCVFALGDLYIGCFKERGWGTNYNSKRIMNYEAYDTSSSTTEMCISECHISGYTYAATQVRLG